ncbi:MAG TPA: hypothetical protein VFX47_02855 [Gammaproteobacteria bacterium]|nr:hypothetical protein [Gammaproteobacteria bacterium]
MTLIVIVIILIAATTLAMLLLHAQERRRIQGRKISMAGLWESWLTADMPDDTERAARTSLLDQVDDNARESVRQSLLTFEAGLHDAAEPMIALRKELMDSMDRRLLNIEILQLPDELKTRLRAQSSEMVQSDPLARDYIAANDLRMALLREYAAQRFGDRSEGDWFDVYRKASRLKQKGARNFIQRTLSGNQSSVDDARYQTMTLVDHEIRARLLRMPAGAPFPGFRADSNTEPGA